MVTLLDWTPPFEYYMAKLVVKNGHQEDACHNELGRCISDIDILFRVPIEQNWESF